MGYPYRESREILSKYHNLRVSEAMHADLHEIGEAANISVSWVMRELLDYGIRACKEKGGIFVLIALARKVETPKAPGGSC